MMQAGICLRQDAETTLPVLTEQHRIRLKEEELSGLESVHMAESETVCAAPGLNTLECITAHSGVSDVHHTHTSLIKTEADLSFTHTGDLIKTECLDSTELGYADHLHPDQIKTEADYKGYQKAEQISDFEDNKCVDCKSHPMKCESSDNLVCEMVNSAINGPSFDHINQTEPSAGEPKWKKEICDLPTQYGDLSDQHSVKENNQIRIVKKNANGNSKHVNCQRRKAVVEPLIINSRKKIHSITCEIGAAEKPFQCTQCEESCPRQADLNTHLKIHKDKSPHKCAKCQKYFCSKSKLNTHLRIHTGEKPYKCPQCEKWFSSRFGLNRHVRIHTGEKPHKCPQCEKCFHTRSDLRRHLRIHTGEKPNKCPQCEKCFHAKSDLNRHLRIHTGNLKTESLSSTELGYVTHLHPDQTKTEADDGGYLKAEHTSELQDVICVHIKSDEMKCESSESLVSDVMNTVMNGTAVNVKDQTEPQQCEGKLRKPNKCPQCEKSFYTKSDLNRHLRIHTGEKPYKCPQCEKRLRTKFDLNRHLRIHTGEKPYKCIHCGKGFSGRTPLRTHLKIHTDEKPYKCISCVKCFSTIGTLNAHLRIHTDENRPNKCPQCEKHLRTKSDLNRHLRIHTGEKPFKCINCGKCFSQRSNLKTHLKIHAVEKP